jgi:hypothetical protein
MAARRGGAALAAAAVLLGGPSAHAAEALGPAYGARVAALPDWRGIWGAAGGPIFGDPAAGLAAFDSPDRDHPPYNPEWEARYQAALAARARGEVVDPVVKCLPHGMPRVMGPMPHREPNAEGVEFVLTPEQVWMTFEWGPQVRRIYIGQAHPPADELFATWNGHSVGRWDGDTLVVDTVGVMAGTYDRTGAPHSDQLRVLERIRRVDAATIEDQMTIEDPVAFTAPWRVVRRFVKRPEADTRLYDFSCLENPPRF